MDLLQFMQQKGACKDHPESRRETITQEIPLLTAPQHVFMQKAQCWERYDLSINRQGANSSKGKQLFKIKDKVG